MTMYRSQSKVAPIKVAMGRKSLAAERRAEILDAYEECILERGFSETTLGDVAAARSN